MQKILAVVTLYKHTLIIIGLLSFYCIIGIVSYESTFRINCNLFQINENDMIKDFELLKSLNVINFFNISFQTPWKY